MAKRIQILFGDISLPAEIDETNTGRAIWEALPLEGRGSRWGQEIYFSVALDLPGENPREVVDPGALAYWPAGPAFCIFWGPTPVSEDKECRPYSPVNVFGRVLGDLTLLNRVTDLSVRVEREP
jgi:hypothetical protein